MSHIYFVSTNDIDMDGLLNFLNGHVKPMSCVLELLQSIILPFISMAVTTKRLKQYFLSNLYYAWHEMHFLISIAIVPAYS